MHEGWFKETKSYYVLRLNTLKRKEVGQEETGQGVMPAKSASVPEAGHNLDDFQPRNEGAIRHGEKGEKQSRKRKASQKKMKGPK